MKTRTNIEWLYDLRARGPEQSTALSDLRSYLLRAALYSLYRSRSNAPHLDRAALEQLAEDVAQEALLAIIKHLEEFRSESKFTTWAYKFAVNFALVAVRREHWKNVSLDEMLEGALPETLEESPAANPDRVAQQSEAWRAIRQVIETKLTERQREAIEAIAFEDVPLDEVASRWGSNRNATYKLLHDARRKLKTELEALGFDLPDLLELFRAGT